MIAGGTFLHGCGYRSDFHPYPLALPGLKMLAGRHPLFGKLNRKIWNRSAKHPTFASVYSRSCSANSEVFYGGLCPAE